MESQMCMVEEYGVTMKGIENINYAETTEKGTNGVYLMKGLGGDTIAVFKPNEEENEYIAGKKKGYKADREVAAFILDHPAFEGGEGFGCVPPTNFAFARYVNGGITSDWGRGSLQQYVPNQEWNNNPEVFATDGVQKMSLIDMRFGNNDRHIGNILRSSINEGRLIPIDHGECFPMEWNNYKFVWTNWRQANIAYPPDMVAYVKRLDVKNDLDILKANGIELGARSEFVYKVQNEVLNAGVVGGYTAKEIGEFMLKAYYAPKDKKPKRKTLIQVMGCRGDNIPEAWSVEESEALKFVHESTKTALEYNRRLA